MRRACALASVAVGLIVASPVRAADLTYLASSFDDDNVFDFHFRVRYDHTEKRAQIKREFEGEVGGVPLDRIATFKDLLYSQQRDTLALRAEFGLFQDLALHLELPIILNETASYTYDAPDGCIAPPAMNPTCVGAGNSTTVRDGILPPGGFDAQHNGVALSGNDVFQAPIRGARGGSGGDAFDTFNVGLSWAPVNQRRDDTKPTWTLGIEGQFSIGNVKAFDRSRPGANHAVSEGVHKLIARTAISKRFRYVDPYIGFWYMYPIARGDSLYKDYGNAQKTKNPQQQAGTIFGFEAVPWERAADQYKIAIDFRGRLEAHFNGKGYSEAWEVFASSKALDCDPAYNLSCDPASGTKNDYQGKPYTGITAIENYPSLGADVAITGQVGKHAHFRLGFDYQHDGSHLITNDDIGTPNPGNNRVSLASEFNPAYRPLIDQTGRRYRVDNVNIYNVYIWVQIMF